MMGSKTLGRHLPFNFPAIAVAPRLAALIGDNSKAPKAEQESIEQKPKANKAPEGHAAALDMRWSRWGKSAVESATPRTMARARISPCRHRGIELVPRQL